MKRRLLLIGAAGLLTLGGAFSTMAAQPTNPGCFGQDRAAGVQAIGGSTWGALAADRAGTNGAQNQAYKDSCGGSPSH
jgi:hypothetical protein